MEELKDLVVLGKGSMSAKYYHFRVRFWMIIYSTAALLSPWTIKWYFVFNCVKFHYNIFRRNKVMDIFPNKPHLPCVAKLRFVWENVHFFVKSKDILMKFGTVKAYRSLNSYREAQNPLGAGRGENLQNIIILRFVFEWSSTLLHHSELLQNY